MNLIITRESNCFNPSLLTQNKEIEKRRIAELVNRFFCLWNAHHSLTLEKIAIRWFPSKHFRVSFISFLPEEILCNHIFSWFSTRELCTLAKVCRSWNRIACDRQILQKRLLQGESLSPHQQSILLNNPEKPDWVKGIVVLVHYKESIYNNINLVCSCGEKIGEPVRQMTSTLNTSALYRIVENILKDPTINETTLRTYFQQSNTFGETSLYKFSLEWVDQMSINKIITLISVLPTNVSVQPPLY